MKRITAVPALLTFSEQLQQEKWVYYKKRHQLS